MNAAAFIAGLFCGAAGAAALLLWAFLVALRLRRNPEPLEEEETIEVE